MAQRSESKFFRSHVVVWSPFCRQNLQPNKFMPRMLKSKLVHNFFWLAQNYNLKKAPNLKIYWKGAKFDILKTAPNLPKENHKSAILKWKFKGNGRHPHQHAQHGNRVPQPGTHPFLIGLNFGFFVKCKCTVVESAVWPDQCALVPFEACNSRLCKSTIFVGVSGGPSALSGRLKILSAVLDWKFLNFANLK